MVRCRVVPALLVLLSALPAAAQPMPVDPVASKACRSQPRRFGCANAANLAVMAAPADLLRGHALGPSDGSLEAAAVERLRTDKVKDLRREGTTDQGSGGGAPR